MCVCVCVSLSNRCFKNEASSHILLTIYMIISYESVQFNMSSRVHLECCWNASIGVSRQSASQPRVRIPMLVRPFARDIPRRCPANELRQMRERLKSVRRKKIIQSTLQYIYLQTVAQENGTLTLFNHVIR